MLIQYTYNFVQMSQLTYNVVTINSTIVSLNVVINLTFKLIVVFLLLSKDREGHFNLEGVIYR